MKFNIYKDAKGLWRWQLLARNGRILADSGEGYARKAHVSSIVGKVITSIEDGKFKVIEPA